MEEGNPIEKFDRYSDEVHEKARYGLAKVIAPISSLFGALVWALISYGGHLQIGYLAIGIGILVGGSIKVFCHPVGKYFAIIAMGYAFLGILIGNLWSIGLFVTQGTNISFTQLILGMDYWGALKYHIQSFDGHDIAFYGLSLGAAYRLAYVRLKFDELDFMLKEKGISVEPRKSGATNLIKRKRR